MTTPKRRRGNWAVQELERLRQLVPRRGIADTALLLRRSEASVLRKAQQLLRVPARRGPWTASDDGRLRESWGVLDLRLLALVLGRTPADVKRRADELRMRLRTGVWTRDELQGLKDLFGTRSDDDLEIALGRSRDDVRAMARQFCLAKDKRFAAHAARGRSSTGTRSRQVCSDMPRWTAAQVDRLQALYADRDNLTVARLLGRSVASVANKANQLGLRKSADLLAQIGRANVATRYDTQSASG